MRQDLIHTVPKPTLGDVVEWMRRFAHKGKTDLVVRKLVEEVCADLASGDYASEAFAIYAWVHQNIRYMRDIHDVEYVKEPAKLIETRAGDCDDMATLIAAMLMACGNRAVFTLVAFDGAPVPSHVFANVVTPHGLVVLDPVANRISAEMLKRVTARTDIEV